MLPSRISYLLPGEVGELGSGVEGFGISARKRSRLDFGDAGVDALDAGLDAVLDDVLVLEELFVSAGKGERLDFVEDGAEALDAGLAFEGLCISARKRSRLDLGDAGG